MFSRIPPQHRATASMNGKVVDIRWTRRAQKLLATRSQPLIVELVLEYKCMPVKSVHFHDATPAGCRYIPVTGRVAICLRVATPVQCVAKPSDAANPASQVTHRRAQTPKQVWFDHKRGNWIGTFSL